MILKPTPLSIAKAAEILKKGGVIALPTETFYGLCANALDPGAVLKVISLKGRSKSKGIPVAVKSYKDLMKFVKKPSPLTRDLAMKFWPGPLSLIFDNSIFPGLIEGDKKSILARQSSGSIIKKLLNIVPFPLTVTSANRSGGANPKSAGKVYKEFKGKLKLIIDGGKLKGALPSTIVDARGKSPIIIRKGKISASLIERAL